MIIAFTTNVADKYNLLIKGEHPPPNIFSDPMSPDEGRSAANFLCLIML
jgi:hypothetical protein